MKVSQSKIWFTMIKMTWQDFLRIEVLIEWNVDKHHSITQKMICKKLKKEIYQKVTQSVEDQQEIEVVEVAEQWEEDINHTINWKRNHMKI